jgi:hypothetical protein
MYLEIQIFMRNGEGCVELCTENVASPAGEEQREQGHCKEVGYKPDARYSLGKNTNLHKSGKYITVVTRLLTNPTSSQQITLTSVVKKRDESPIGTILVVNIIIKTWNACFPDSLTWVPFPELMLNGD